MLFGLAGAAGLSQFPEFYQQYLQRLSGRAEEAVAQVRALDARAAAAGLDRYAYVRVFTDNSDGVIHGEGEAMVRLLGRQVELARAVRDLRETPPPFRTLAFGRNLYWEDVRATGEAYQPALPLTLAGFVYALAGFFAGALGFSFLLWCLPRRRRFRRA